MKVCSLSSFRPLLNDILVYATSLVVSRAVLVTVGPTRRGVTRLCAGSDDVALTTFDAHGCLLAIGLGVSITLTTMTLGNRISFPRRLREGSK